MFSLMLRLCQNRIIFNGTIDKNKVAPALNLIAHHENIFLKLALYE
jgi:hypothetical protein